METSNSNKVERVLSIYSKLIGGALVRKSEEAANYGVNERSIQRDIDDIRAFPDNGSAGGIYEQVVYDHIAKGYRLESVHRIDLKNSEMLAFCKILLDSRAFTKDEMVGMLDKLVACCVPQDEQRLIRGLIKNEEFHYVEPRHKTKFMDTMWDIGQAIYENGTAPEIKNK